MELVPHVGLGQLSFGLSQAQVTDLLGEPESVQSDTWEDGSTLETWFYHDQTLNLSFDSNTDKRLTNITSSYASIRFKGLPVIGLPKEPMEKLFPKITLDSNIEGNGSDYLETELCLAFWVQADEVKSVTLMVPFDESGERPLWPVDSNSKTQ